MLKTQPLKAVSG